MQEMIKMLCDYLRINTAQLTPDYQLARKFLKNQAEQDGFMTKEISLPSGGIVLVITLKGSNELLPALALNHHMDVVPVEGESWQVPPFSGAIKDNYIISRGTQDMKGVGIVHYAALKMLKDSGAPVQRTVHLLAVPDEEIGGFTGTGELIKTVEFQELNIGFVLDEGLPSGDQNELYIKVSERKPLQVRLTSTGKAGHGSHLLGENAIHKLLNVLQDIVTLHNEQQQKAHEVPSGKLLSLNITSLKAGIFKDGDPAINIVPDSACATVDIRIPQATSLNEIKKFLKNVCEKYKISYEILACVEDSDVDGDPSESDVYAMLEKVIVSYGFCAVPHYFEGATDARFYNQLGIIALGFTPFTSCSNLHGVDERISIEEFEKGILVMKSFIELFCGLGDKK